MGKSMKKSIKHSLSNTIQKSIINLSQHKNLNASKFDSSTHQFQHNQLATSMNKSKTFQNANKSNHNYLNQKSNLGNSLYKSNHGASSIMRK